MMSNSIPRKLEVLIDKITSVLESSRNDGENNGYTPDSPKTAAAKNAKRKKRKLADPDEDGALSKPVSNGNIQIKPRWLAKELLEFIYGVRIYRAYISSSDKDYVELNDRLKDFESGAFEALNSLESFLSPENVHLLTPSNGSDKLLNSADHSFHSVHHSAAQAYCFSVLVTITEHCEY